MKPWTCLKIFFGHRFISKNLWPPQSPDLTISDYFLWGYLKDKVYEGNPQTIDNLKISIIQRIQEITPSMLKTCFEKHAQTSSALSPRKGWTFSTFIINVSSVFFP